MNCIARQTQREEIQAQQGKDKFEEQIRQAQLKQREDSTFYGAKLLADLYSQSVPHIEYYIEKQTLTRRKSEIYREIFKPAMESEALIKTAKENKISVQQEVAKTFSYCFSQGLVEKCHGEVDLTGLAHKVIKYLCLSYSLKTSDENIKSIQTGSLQLCRMIIESVDWLNIEDSVGQRKETEFKGRLVVNMSEEKLQLIQSQVTSFAEHSPVHEPMVCKPKKHYNLFSGKGGFLLHQSPLLKRPAKQNGKIHPLIEEFQYGRSEKATKFFDDINKKQEIGFRINKEMFDLIPVLLEKNIVVDGLDGNLEVMKELERKATIQAVEDINKERLETFGEGAFLVDLTEEHGMMKDAEFRAVQKFNGFHKVMKSCTVLVNEEAFYFPIYLDNRAREYYYSRTINPQGNELHKCLLEFVDCRLMTLETVQDSLVALANCMGYDKKTIEYRKQKALEFIPTILEWDLDKVLAGLDSETTLTGLAICLDIKNFFEKTEKGEEHYTHLPLHMDSCNSGSQINGLLLADKTNCRLANIINVEGDTLEDTYLEVAVVLKKKMEANNESGVFTKFLNTPEIFNRKVFKKSSMTRTNYGAGFLTCSDDIKHQLKTNHREVWDTWSQADKKLFIAESVEAVDASLPASNNYKKFARSMIKESLGYFAVKTKDQLAVIQEEHPDCQYETHINPDTGDVSCYTGVVRPFIAYNQPLTGFPVVLREQVEELDHIKYKDINSKKCKSYWFKCKKDKTNIPKTCSSVVPSITHSFDAAVLPVSRSKMDCVSVTIHDSIACLAGDVSEQLLPSLREAYYDMATMGALESIRDQLGAKTPVPYTNDFNVEEVLVSKHLYS